MKIWCEVLKIAAFDRAAEFSTLGGHSLLATQIIARVHDATGVQLPIDVMFEEPTVPGLARAVESKCADRKDAVPAIVPLQQTAGPTVQVQRYFFRLNEVDPTTSFAKEYVSWRIVGPLDCDALSRAMSCVVQRHEILRTNFERQGASVRQIVRPAEPPFLPTLEVDDQSAHANGVLDPNIVERSARPFIDRTFDVERAEVVRTKVIRIRNDDHVMITAMHHVAFDYASWFVYADELGSAYRMFVEGMSPADVSRTLGELPFQFLDVATRLDAYADSPAGGAALDFWRRKLERAEAVRLPADLPRDDVDAARDDAQRRGVMGSHVDQYTATFPAGVVTVSTDAAFAQAAIDFILRERVTPLAYLLTGLVAVLHGETEQTDLALNTNVGTRPGLRADRLIGPFHSPTFVRVDLSSRPTYRQLLAELRQAVIDMLRYAYVPVLERVQHHVGRLGFGFFGMNVPEPVLQLGAARAAILPPWPSRTVTHFDFWPMLDLRSRGLTVHFIYNQRLFRHETVERLAARYLEVLRSIMTTPEARVTTRR